MLPASLYVEMALAAAAEVFAKQPLSSLKNIEFHQALFLPDGGTRPLQLILSPACGWSSIISYLQSSRRESDRSSNSWTLHASGEGLSPARWRRLASSRAGDARGDPGSMLRRGSPDRTITRD